MIMFIFLPNIDICFTEIDVLKIPKSQIYYPINEDSFYLLQNLFVFNLLKVDYYKCNIGHQGYSIILPSISMLNYYIYMHDIR
jgi:hypothetical protein